MLEGLQAELEMRQREYAHAIDHAIDRLKDYKGRAPSTHLGHNLANHATELATLAGKIEMVENTIRWMKEAK